MSVKIITGNGATVNAEDDRALNMAMISKKNVVFANVGEVFRAELINNNCIRIHSGEGMMQGIHFRIPYNDFYDVDIETGIQGGYRYDIVAMQYEKNAETNEETVRPIVLKGTTVTTGMNEAKLPTISEASIYQGDMEAIFPLYVVEIEGLSVKSVKSDFERLVSLSDLHPVGSVYISINDVNPGTLFGGIWERFAKGRTLVGVDEADDDFDESEKELGEKEHTLSLQEMPAHTHSPSLGTDYGFNTYKNGMNVTRAHVTTTSTGRYTIVGNSENQTDLEKSGLSFSRKTDEQGGGNAHNNIQPSVTVYMWVRVE